MTINVCDVCKGREAQTINIPVGTSIDPADCKTVTDYRYFDLCPKHLKDLLELFLVNEQQGAVAAGYLAQGKLPSRKDLRK